MARVEGWESEGSDCLHSKPSQNPSWSGASQAVTAIAFSTRISMGFFKYTIGTFPSGLCTLTKPKTHACNPGVLQKHPNGM